MKVSASRGTFLHLTHKLTGVCTLDRVGCKAQAEKNNENLHDCPESKPGEM